jgi:hypothetical protein
VIFKAYSHLCRPSIQQFRLLWVALPFEFDAAPYFGENYYARAEQRLIEHVPHGAGLRRLLQ